ncbi:AraC family transcriptional regulator [Actinoplanes friuliensis]|nr:AraC family transcriptional regulator [Actinoplanes friuliensis]
MDTLTGLLDGPRARGAFLLRSILNPPWCLRIQDEAPLSLVTLVRGSAWIIPDDDEPTLLHPGDVAILRGPDAYALSDAPATPVQVVIHPGQRCTTVEGEEQRDLVDLGVRTWGGSLDGETVMLSGTYQLHSEVSRRLLDALPALLIRPAGTGDRTLVDLLEKEMTGTSTAQELVLDRILDLLLVSVLRAWLDSTDPGVPGWHQAQSDPVVGPALRMLHDDPARAWTVADLAVEAGVSRASLARRFTELVGEPPMAYLTRWRLTLAADLLRTADATIGGVARRVGYGSSFALSTAFKRERGVSPQEYRRRSGASPQDVRHRPGVVRLG